MFLKIYNPFPVSFRTNEMILRANTTLKYKNFPGIGLPPVAINRLNSIGFRGAELPYNYEEYCSIITVGGSTTVCRVLNEGKDWTHLFRQKMNDPNIWVNNAGLTGHSTYGHLALLNAHISNFAPDIIIYLVGINEVERADLNAVDLRWDLTRTYLIKDWLKKNSETALLFESLHRKYFGYKYDGLSEMRSIKNPKFVEIDTQKINYFTKNKFHF
ncbi:MAG: SGNH/GDSL hydrolase family protein [Bacteroidetes bacterium]|nr:SGNH/GDSL hydrolase family protein [Bacteroidota bacterium]